MINEIEWTEQQHAEMARRFESGGVLAVAAYVVELMRECGGTMTAERIADLRESMEALAKNRPAIAEEIGEALRHITAQGATVATLRAEVKELERANEVLRWVLEDSAPQEATEPLAAEFDRGGSIHGPTPERVKEEQNALHPSGSCVCGGEGACEWCRQAAPPAYPDAQQQWMSSHPGEVMKHRGKHIAVHATKGIVASAVTYGELLDQLGAQKIPDDEVVIEFVRWAEGQSTSGSLAERAVAAESRLESLREAMQDQIDETTRRADKYQRLYKKWKRRAQKAALDFYEGFLIGHQIGLKLPELKASIARSRTP